jgi:hypothetical protein
MFSSLSPRSVLETLKHTFTRVVSVLGRLRPTPRPPAPPGDAAFAKLQRLRRRYDGLLKHIEAGTLPLPSQAKPKALRAAERPAKPRQPDRALRRKGWLIAACPEEAPMGPLLARWIALNPGLQAAALASPDANRLLRSILWAAGANPPDILKKLDRPKRRDSKAPTASLPVEAPPEVPPPEVPPPDAVQLQSSPGRSAGPPGHSAPLRAAVPQPLPPRRLGHRSRDPCQISPAETVPPSHVLFVAITKQTPRLGTRVALR